MSGRYQALVCFLLLLSLGVIIWWAIRGRTVPHFFRQTQRQSSGIQAVVAPSPVVPELRVSVPRVPVPSMVPSTPTTPSSPLVTPVHIPPPKPIAVRSSSVRSSSVPSSSVPSSSVASAAKRPSRRTMHKVTPQSDVTVVTAYYVLKSKHPVARYLEWIKNFFQLRCSLLIFTDAYTLPLLQKCDPEAKSEHHRYVLCPLEEFVSHRWQHYWEKDHARDSEKSIHSPELYQIWAEKSFFLRKACDLVPSSYLVWCDMGYIRSAGTAQHLAFFPQVNKIKGVTLLQIKPFLPSEREDLDTVDERFRYESRVGGGMIAGHRNHVRTWCDYYEAMLKEFMDADLFAGKDQSLYAFIILRHPELCHMVQSPRGDHDWFYLMEYLRTPG